MARVKAGPTRVPRSLSDASSINWDTASAFTAATCREHRTWCCRSIARAPSDAARSPFLAVVFLPMSQRRLISMMVMLTAALLRASVASGQDAVME